MSLTLGLILALSFLGILNTLYLSYHTVRKTLVKCLFFPPEWCEKVQQSKFSRTFGIPNSFMGFAFYTAIFALSSTLLLGRDSFLLINTVILLSKAMVSVIMVGFLFSLYFTFIQAFVLRAFCTWCVFSAIDFAILFAVSFYLS